MHNKLFFTTAFSHEALKTAGFLALNLAAAFIFCASGSMLSAGVLSEADSIFARQDMESIKRSINLYRQVLEQSPDSYEARWKCSRACRDYADMAKKQRVQGWNKLCASYGNEGMRHARAAIALQPHKPEGYYYYGLSVGAYSDGVSVLTAIKEGLKTKTQTSFEKAYSLDKTYDDAGPVLAIGRFWAVLPWPLRDRDRALAYYREYQATPYFQDNIEAGLFLAELLVQMGGKKNEAEAWGYIHAADNSTSAFFRNWAQNLADQLR